MAVNLDARRFQMLRLLRIGLDDGDGMRLLSLTPEIMIDLSHHVLSLLSLSHQHHMLGECRTRHGIDGDVDVIGMPSKELVPYPPSGASQRHRWRVLTRRVSKDFEEVAFRRRQCDLFLDDGHVGRRNGDGREDDATNGTTREECREGTQSETHERQERRMIVMHLIRRICAQPVQAIAIGWGGMTSTSDPYVHNREVPSRDLSEAI